MAKQLEPMNKSKNISIALLDSLVPWASLKDTENEQKNLAYINALLELLSFVQQVVGAMQESVAKSLEIEG